MVALLISLGICAVVVIAGVLAWRWMRRIDDELDYPEAKNRPGSEVDPNAARLGIGLSSSHGPGGVGG